LSAQCLLLGGGGEVFPQISSKPAVENEREYTDPAGSTIGFTETRMLSNRRGECGEKPTELAGWLAAVDPPGGAGSNLKVRIRKRILVTNKNVPIKIVHVDGISLIRHALLWAKT
jgi:hypothetical protein